MAPRMTPFSIKYAFVKGFEKWARKYDVAMNAMGFMCFLDLCGCLDEDAVDRRTKEWVGLAEPEDEVYAHLRDICQFEKKEG